MNPNNWNEVYFLYHDYVFSAYQASQAEAVWNTFKTALLRFLLSELGFQRKDFSSKMTKEEVESAEEYLKTLKMRSLLQVRRKMSEALENMSAPLSSRNTYTSRINQFLNWGENQVWWPNNRGQNGVFRNQCCPARRTERKLRPPKLTSRKGMEVYGLKESQLPNALRSELATIMLFLTQPNNPERTFKAIEESTAKSYLKSLLLILGWFHKFHDPPIALQELSLDLIFPVFDEAFLSDLSEREKQKFWQKQKANLKKWLFGYQTFLQQVQQSYSPRTWLGKLEAVYALGRCRWSNQIEHKADYNLIPTLCQIREGLNEVQEEIDSWSSSGRYIADQSQKWPEIPEGENVLAVIQNTVVERLRQRCLPRTAIRAKVRTPQTLAVCHQRFLMWALHALIPAHRQQVARTEKIATSCPIDRPLKVPIDGLYHPLPPDTVLLKRHNGTVKANFLCRLYIYKGKEYPSGVWLRVMRDYKTWKTHGDQEYVIPNWGFQDGSTLYEYIERYLYGYWLPGSFKGAQIYSWWQSELQGQLGKWISKGRSEFNPIDCCSTNHSDNYWAWGNLFLMPTRGLGFSDADFSDSFAQGSLTTIEKWITPHILRSAWATWGYEQGLTEAELRSLAYSMGMTIETLRKTYERCTSEEKRRAIEQSIDARLFKTGDIENVSVEKLIRSARSLNLLDRQKLIVSLLDATGKD